MPQKKDLKEADLFVPVRDYLTACGYEIRSEIADCDIVGVKDGEVLAVELKKNLNATLLTQAAKRQRFCDRVYIAIIKPEKRTTAKEWQDTLYLIRRLELGLILVNFKYGEPLLELALDPAPFDRAASTKSAGAKKRRASLLAEFSARSVDLNIGGTTGIEKVTAYREKCVYIACCLLLFGPIKLSKIKALGCDKTRAAGIIRNNHYGWFQKNDGKEINLTEAGKAELLRYDALTGILCEKIRTAAEKAGITE